MSLQGSCYKISSKALNWNAAKAACEAMGSKLAMVTSQAEQQALIPKLVRSVWIGLHRNPKDKSRWLWADGTQATYTNWYTGKPNSVREECGVMYKSRYRGRWNDWLCSNTINYICEMNGGYEIIII